MSPASPRPLGSDRSATSPGSPKKAAQDSALSMYLASLGRTRLLSADDERELAAELLRLEVEAWQAIFRIPGGAAALLELLPEAALPEECDALARQVHQRARKGRGAGRAQAADILRLAHMLREHDEERALVAAVLERCRAQTRARDDDGAAVREAEGLRRRALAVRNRFVQANLRLVVSVARRFHHYRLPLIDLIQEGNLGLIKSVHRFDHRKGFRFSTYAHWWIRQAIERAIMNKGAQVRLPVHIFDQRREVARAQNELEHQLGRAPSREELSVALGMPLRRLEDVMQAIPREPVSLGTPIGDGDDRTLADVVHDVEARAPDELVVQVDESSWVRRILEQLPPMEQDILRRRFALDHDLSETLEEIGRGYALSRERVRQLQVQGLRKMADVCQQQLGWAS